MSLLPRRAGAVLGLALVCLLTSRAAAHGVASGDAALVLAGHGARPGLFAWLGAKHMVTGYDHLLYLTGVVFFVRSVREVALYATLFALGHSLTLCGAVLSGVQGSETLVDAFIGLSVVYKAAENLGAFARLGGLRIDPRAAVLGFGLVHGVGLAAKLQSLRLPRDGLLPNLLAFNVGVELGQLTALAVVMAGVARWRKRPSFARGARWVNGLAVAGGLALMAQHLTAYAVRADALARRHDEELELRLGLGEELEYKVEMAAGAELDYALRVQAEGDYEPRIYFDLHGESAQGSEEHSYRKEDGATEAAGALTAPFAGLHGFYLLNDSDGPVVVRLQFAGKYAHADQFAGLAHTVSRGSPGSSSSANTGATSSSTSARWAVPGP